MHKIVWLVLAGSLMISHRVLAAVMPCAGCLPWERVQLAEAMGPGLHVIYDFPGSSVHTFEVSCGDWIPFYEPDDAEGDVIGSALGKGVQIAIDSGAFASESELMESCSASPMATDPGIDAAFDLLRRIWLETGGLEWHKRIQLHRQNDGVPGGGSALEMTRDFSLMQPAIDYIAVNIASLDRLNYLAQVFIGLVTGSDVIINVTLTFSDGSEIEISCNIRPRERCEYTPGSARDPYGQPIPDSLSPNVPRTFHLGSSWADDWYDNAFAHGIPVYYVGSFRPLRVSCEPASDGRYSCTGY